MSTMDRGMKEADVNETVTLWPGGSNLENSNCTRLSPSLGVCYLHLGKRNWNLVFQIVRKQRAAHVLDVTGDSKGDGGAKFPRSTFQPHNAGMNVIELRVACSSSDT